MSPYREAMSFHRSIIRAACCTLALLNVAGAQKPTVSVPSFQMNDASHGWAIAGGKLYETSTGGRAWKVFSTASKDGIRPLQLFNSPTANRAYFLAPAPQTGSARLGLYVADRQTKTWTLLSLLPGSSNTSMSPGPDVFVLSPKVLWLNNTLGGVGGSLITSLYRSLDGGRHWTLLNYNGLATSATRPTGRGIVAQSLQSERVFSSLQRGWFVSSGNLSGHVLIQTTVDGGSTWTARPLSLFAPNYGGGHPRGFTFGRAGVLTVPVFSNTNAAPPALQTFTTSDRGQTWRVNVPLMLKERQIIDTTQPLSFADRAHGWAYLGSTLYRTFDGGHSWQQVPVSGLPQSAKLGVMQFVNLKVGWISTSRGLYRTQDGGQHWLSASPRQ